MSEPDPFVTHLATVLGIIAGDRYGSTPEMPETDFGKYTSDDLYRDSMSSGGKKQDGAANIDMSGDPQLVAAKAAYAAGFRGDALVNMIAIAGRESAYNPAAVGDEGLQTSTWGPSVGLFQIRTLKGETGSGTARDINRLRNNPVEQARAAWELSAGGTNFGPWKLHGGGYLDRTNVVEARRIAALVEGGA